MNGKVREWLAREVLGEEDEALIASLYEDYLATLDREIAKVQPQMSARDFAGLDMTAHTLKGAAGAVGDEEMFEASLRLRDAAKAEDLSAAVLASAEIASLRAAR